MQHRKVLTQVLLGLISMATLGLAFAADPEDKPGTLALERNLNSISRQDEPVVEELRVPPPAIETIDLTAQTDDLWLRIRNGFSMPGLANDLVLQQQLWYQNHPEYLRRMVERSKRYLHHIVAELEKRGMPTELALLPMVESSFNPMAYSRAHASGLWQFIPSTGKRYDLQQNWWHDQRRDIVASTSAALDYLQTIYDMHGDWHLALASYNWGEGAVKRAIQKNAAQGLPTDYSSLTMPAETRQYVPKLIALKNIFSNPRLLADLRIPEISNRPYFATYEPKKPIDVKVAAKLAEMSVDDFVALNPAHNRPVIKPESQLVIPADKIEKFQANLENHDAPLSYWRLYTLKSGERLDRVAPKFGITLADLKRVNGLNGKLKIASGSSLLVPSRDGGEMEKVPDQVRLPEIVPERPAKATKKSRSGSRAGKTGRAIAKHQSTGKSGKTAAKRGAVTKKANGPRSASKRRK